MLAEWIDVRDKLPEKSEKVICAFDDGKHKLIEIACLYDNKGKQFKAITHWMPLPAHPISN